MATDDKLNWLRKVFGRVLPGRSSREVDRDVGNNVPKQGQIESNVPVECSSATEEGEQSQPRESGVRDTDQGPATGTCEATACQLASSLNTELSSPQQGNDTKPIISDVLAQFEDYQLLLLTNFYQEGLKPAMENGVDGLSLKLRQGRHFSESEHKEVAELVEMGKWTESCKLFLSLVKEKGAQARRVMWESFVEMRKKLPKVEKILMEIQELGPDPYEHMDITRSFYELSSHLKDVQQKHKEFLRRQTETLRVNTILMREKVKVFQLVDRYAELTVISIVGDRRLAEYELLAKGRDHEHWRKTHRCRKLENLRTDQLFQSNFSRSSFKSGSSAVVAGIPGIGKTTMVQKIVYDWATGKIYHQFHFVFTFKFRELNTINCIINLSNLVLLFYPYLRNILETLWKNPESLLFIFDGLDEFNDGIDFADSRRNTESQYACTDPEFRCKVSDIVYSLIQHKLLPGCSVLVTTRPTALHLLEKAEISVRAEIMGFVGEERKEYFIRYFEDQKVAAAVFKHVKENEILSTMSYNPSYCGILALVLGPFFTQRGRDPQRVPQTITQLCSYYIYNILKNHRGEIENPCDVLLRVGQMAYRGVSEKKVVFTDGDLLNYNVQPSQFLTELLEREDSPRCVVYTFPHLTIQEFVAALAQFLNPHPGDMQKFLTESGNTTDGRFEVFLRFVAGLSSPMTTPCLEDFLGPFPHETTLRVIEWVKEKFNRQIESTSSVDGKRCLLKTLHYLFESQNRGLAQDTLGSVETLSFSGMTLTPIDCAVLSHVIGLCDTIKHLDLWNCRIQCEGIHRLEPGLHKCLKLRLGWNTLGDSGAKLVFQSLKNTACKIQKLCTNRSLTELDVSGNKLGDSGVKLVSAALRNPECKIQKLVLIEVGLTDSGTRDLATTLSTNRSVMALDLNKNRLGDSGVKLVSAALRNPECKIQKLGLNCVGLTDSGADDILSALITNQTLTGLDLGLNSLTDRSISALRRLILTRRSLEWIWLVRNQFSETGRMKLQESRPTLRVIL
ncbi:NACHT, LRR and PYD domains-containing protein 3-like isoform X2 [Hemitrygon akajei]|uniref:NACHT, LRR and PYD domains-containing protein 3-like isoform X2 n=1 Tax=Hemitrygon akajei TaxID=2704970 RepID=UPI003BF971C8